MEVKKPHDILSKTGQLGKSQVKFSMSPGIIKSGKLMMKLPVLL
jgi:hypothetical protein